MAARDFRFQLFVIALYSILSWGIPANAAAAKESAEATATPVAIASGTAPATALPRCIDGPHDIQKVVTSVKNNRKNDAKYNGYREVLRDASDKELIARLAYAETVGANCPELNTKIAPRIVAVIANRVRIRKGDAKSVVFERDQFSSSLNVYKESRYRDFLCPKDAELWELIMNVVDAELNQPTHLVSSTTVNYFLYKHSPRWTRAPWSHKEDTTNTTPEIRTCMRTFRVPGWK